MRLKTVRLDDQTRNILLRSVIEANRLTLPEQLDRADYERVNKAIVAAGGKWNRKERCHLFPDNVRDCMELGEDTVEIVNHKQTFQAFYTPTIIANEMARQADIFPGCKILEPSIGHCSLAAAACRFGGHWESITGIDVDPKAIEYCREVGGSFQQLVCADFLTCRPGPNKFDRILMNPPFSMGDDIKHVRHALDFLKPGGTLIAIVGTGPKQTRAFKHGHFPIKCDWQDLPAGTFSESGTEVNTAIITINKP